MFNRRSPASYKFLRLIRQQHPVGGQRHILNSVDLPQPSDQLREPLAQQRLPARDAQLAHAQRHRDPHEPLNLLERQNLLARLKLHALFRHAVEAANVAAIRNADAQVVVHPVESIDERSHVHFTASIRSIGSRARSITSAANSTRGCRFCKASRSFSSVFSRM